VNSRWGRGQETYGEDPCADENLREDALAKARQADAVVMAMGITPSMEGEEMDVHMEGFRGGDRTDIALPKAQEDLIKDVHARACRPNDGRRQWPLRRHREGH
jgi:hypothetical protein